MTQPRDEAMRVWERAHGAAYDRRPLDHQAAATVIQQALDDQVKAIVAWLRACELSSAIPDDPAQIVSDLADAIQRGGWRST